MISPSKAQIKPGKLLINGKWQDSVRGGALPTVNPATAAVLTMVAEAASDDVDLAVKAARRAFEGGDWKKMHGSDRAKVLWRCAELIDKHSQELAELESLDSGRPIHESSRLDVPMAADCFRYFSGWATNIQGESLPVKGNCLNYTIREPLGVVGIIVPWNLPLMLGSWKVAPALAAGNTVILKPAEQTPLSALRLGEILMEAGLPEGVLNIVPGLGPVTGEALVSHPNVDKIAFTGSQKTGQEVMRTASRNLKRIALQLGGKSPNIVFADADIDAAVRAAVEGIFVDSGQLCTAASRLLLEDSIHDQFVEKLLARTKELRPGDPLDPATRLGPLVSELQLAKVLGYVASGKNDGAKLAIGGDRATVLGLEKGFFVQPTVFTDVRQDMKIAREEIGGPVLSVVRFKEADEAVKIANSLLYGLSAGVWSRDIRKVHRVARELQAGSVWINTYNVFDPASPFGGFKMSGFGRDLGRECLAQYTLVKSVWVDLTV
ncbi:MAG: aldehyde dehydrogenase family protein [Candidatus Riflebacteria bacterium]|nr:aldehyde dehydrogenase family protein [Candidatus Riflebacteria bacterium]